METVATGSSEKSESRKGMEARWRGQEKGIVVLEV